MINYSVKENLNTNVNDLSYDLLKAAEAMCIMVEEYNDEIVLENFYLYPGKKGDGKGFKIMIRSHRHGHNTDTAKENPTKPSNVHDLSIKLFNIDIRKGGKTRKAKGEEFIIGRKKNPKTGKQEFNGIADSEWNKIVDSDVREILEYIVDKYFDQISDIWDTMNDTDADILFDELDTMFKADKIIKKFK